MKKISIILIIIATCIVIYLLNFRDTQPPAKITKEYLSGKRFVSVNGYLNIMGIDNFTFIDTKKVSYTVKDKRPFGYEGTYSFNYDEKGKQYIKIKKDDLTVILFIKSPTELKVISANPKSYTPSDALYKWMNVSPSLDKIYELYVPDNK